MRRRGRFRRDESITLFPFLAVLICTMGSLIVLLVIVVQQARASAEQVADDWQSQQLRESEAAEKLQQEHESLNWQIQVLEQSRGATLAQLQDRRRQLSDLEEAIRDVKQQLARVMRQAERLESDAGLKQTDLEATRQRIVELRDQIAAKREELQRAREAYAERKPSFAIVAYEGPHGTDRQPFFVECLADRVVLQPEGIELFGRDFEGPIGDDNPLAAALRAKQEYLARSLGDQAGDPYPLLVVRPRGAHSYAAARAALRSWDAEFGYELIDDPMDLKYPTIDAATRDVMQQAVEDARRRRRLLQTIAPAHYGRGRGDALLRPSHQGGFASDGGGAPRAWPASGSTTPFGSSQAGAAGGTPASGASSGMTSPQLDPSSSDVSAGHGGGPGERSDGSGTLDSSSDPASASGHPQHGSGHDAHQDGPSGQPAGTASHGPSSQQSGGSGSPASPSLGGTPGAGAAGAVSNNGAAGPTDTGPSVAQFRGRNWGLPSSTMGATGITRPIQITCYPDRLVIQAENPLRESPSSIAIEGSLRDEADLLVSRLWKRMESWGIAGPGLYWKPVLDTTVARGGEARFTELRQLLQDSGIEIRRKIR